MLLLLLFASSTFWVLTNWWRNRDKRKLYNQLKSDLKCWPIVGHGLYLTGTSADRMAAIDMFGRHAVKCGGSTCIWLGNRLVLVMVDPVDTDVVLKKFVEKDTTIHTIKQFLGDGLIFSPESIWRPRRKIILQNFSRKRLDQFMTIQLRRIETLVDRLETEVGSGAFPLHHHIMTCSMASFCETGLGIKADDQLDISIFRKNFERQNQLQSARLQPWLRNDLIFRFTSGYHDFKASMEYMWNFLNKLIDDKREAMRKEYKNLNNSGETKAEGFISIMEYLVDTSNRAPLLTDKAIQEELLTLMIASLDTIGVAVSFTALMLSHYQNVQEKVYRELKEYFGDSKRTVTIKDLPHLKYLEAVIKETMRLYPPVPIALRNVDKAITLPSGKTLTPDITIMVNIWTLHRNEKYWGPDADIFKPERFLDGGPKQPNAYMPFSRGPRNCIGFQYAPMAVTSILVEMLRSYRILPPGCGSDSDSAFDYCKPLKVKFDITLKHVDNFMIQLARR